MEEMKIKNETTITTTKKWRLFSRAKWNCGEGCKN